MRTVVVTDPPRADIDDAETLGRYGAATVHEALGRVGYLGPEFRPAWPGARAGGTAVTVLCWPGDNLADRQRPAELRQHSGRSGSVRRRAGTRARRVS